MDLSWVRDVAALASSFAAQITRYSSSVYHPRLASGSIKWTPNAQRGSVENVHVDYGCSHVAVAKELLDRADVVAGFEEVRGKTVAECVACGGLGQGHRTDCVAKSSLKDGFMQVVASALKGLGMKVDSCRWKDPLPGPLTRRVLVLRGKCAWKLDMTCAARQVGPVLRFDTIKMLAKRATNPKREDCDPIFLALRVSYQQVPRRKVDVLHPKSRALEKAQAGAIEQL